MNAHLRSIVQQYVWLISDLLSDHETVIIELFIVFTD